MNGETMIQEITGAEWQAVKDLCQRQWFSYGHCENPFRADQWQFQAFAEKILEIHGRLRAMTVVIDGEFRRLPAAPVLEV